MVTAILKRNVYLRRYKGYIAGLYNACIPLDGSLAFIKDLKENCGIEVVMQILKMDPLPDGAFITNDFSAAVCMQTLKSHGIRIPEDIAIVGFNNDPIGKIVEPMLTTISYPGIDMGEIIASNMVNNLRGGANVNHTKTIIVRSDLIVRKSSLKKGKFLFNGRPTNSLNDQR
jgi:LacI family transcriptional regulator